MSTVIHGTKANPIQGKKNISLEALGLWYFLNAKMKYSKTTISLFHYVPE